MSTLKIMKVAALENNLYNHSQYPYLAKMKISLYIRLLFVLCKIWLNYSIPSCNISKSQGYIVIKF